MNGVFISYSGSRVERATLFFSLREHGINPWRDVERLGLGDDSTEVIEKELRTCSGVILWINEEVLESSYVRRIELPSISKAWREGNLRLVPVFDGMSPAEGSRRLSQLGIEVGDSNGYQVDPRLDVNETAAAIARRYVGAHANDARRMRIDPVVRLVSYDDTAPLRKEAVLNLDWRHHLADGSLSESGERTLRSALVAATGALKDAYGASEITLAVKGHLPLACAIGHAFAEPTGCTLLLPRDGSTWAVSRTIGQVLPLKERAGMKGPIDFPVTSVEVSVTRDVEVGVDSYVSEGNRYRHRAMFFPENGLSRDSVKDSATVNGWARQIGDAITHYLARSGVDRINLFLATPIELAIAIGWWANAAGPIELMDWRGKVGPYERMWTLP